MRRRGWKKGREKRELRMKRGGGKKNRATMGVAACLLHVTWARFSILLPHLSLILRT